MSKPVGGFFPLNQSVTVHKSDKGVDPWGLPVKSDSSTSYRVRLEFNGQSRLIQQEDGKEIVYTATIFFKGAVPVNYRDYIEYDSGFNGNVIAQPRNIVAMTDMSGKVVYTRVII